MATNTIARSQRQRKVSKFCLFDRCEFNGKLYSVRFIVWIMWTLWWRIELAKWLRELFVCIPWKLVNERRCWIWADQWWGLLVGDVIFKGVVQVWFFKLSIEDYLQFVSWQTFGTIPIIGWILNESVIQLELLILFSRLFLKFTTFSINTVQTWTNHRPYRTQWFIDNRQRNADKWANRNDAPSEEDDDN